MSEVITIDTSAGIIKQDERLEPLTICADVHPFLTTRIPEYTGKLPNADISKIASLLKFTMKLYNGIGLAANQCGLSVRMFVMGTDQFQMVCINPKIIDVSPEVVKDNEGCLSAPAFYVKIDRPKWCDVEFHDENGNLKSTRLDGLSARCFLHEMDHLNGIKFTHNVGPVAMKFARQRQTKIIRTMNRLQVKK